MTLGDFFYLRFISQSTLLTLKIVSTAIALLFISAIIFLIRRTSWLRYRYGQDITEFFTSRPYEVKKFEKIWAKIMSRLEQPSEGEHKLAIIEADSLLNEILEKMGFQGETLGGKLEKVTADILPRLQEIQEAHKFRNNVVHDPDYRVTLEQAEKTIKIYQKALQDLNAI